MALRTPNLLVINKNLLNNWLLKRNFSIETTKNTKDHYKLLVIGGGTGGLAISSKLVKKLGKGNVGLVDSCDWHYYQPGWTLVGGGIKPADAMKAPQESLIPKGVEWIKTNAAVFDPENNSVTLKSGKNVKYDYLIVATGIHANFEGIKGLKDALENDQDVVSIYSPEYVKKVFPAIKNFKGGNAIFTFPKVPIKCPGAPQKIMYLAEDYLRKNGIRDKAIVSYHTTLPVIFGVKKYAESLMKVVKERNIELNTLSHLVEVDYKNKKAVFERIDAPGTFTSKNYSILHAAPPMLPAKELRESKLVDATGFVDVQKETLQHKKYENVFAIGDCANLPTSKTAAAISVQSDILQKNILAVMNGSKDTFLKYDGYTSCPLVTGYGKLILAEFDFNGNPLETFPVDQGKESRIMYHLKTDFMPGLYWNALVKGYWNGPSKIRKVIGKKQN